MRRPKHRFTMKREKPVYTRGELNRLVDAFLHPLAKINPHMLVLDGIVHAIIEQNPSESVMKFVEYSLPELLSQLMRTRKHR